MDGPADSPEYASQDVSPAVALAKRFLRACNSQTNEMNGVTILRLSLLSRQVMQAWRDEDNLADFHCSGAARD